MKTTQTATQVIPILGDPVAQVATPALWNEVFRARGQNAVCVPFDLPAAGVAPFLQWVRQARNVPGFLSTTPHKAALAQACSELSEAAALLGVANTVRVTADGDLIGDMFDGAGMLDAIAQTGAAIAQARIVICGAGAAGGAIAIEAVKRGAAAICIIDTDTAAASRLAGQLAWMADLEVSTALPADADILINASPAGSPAAPRLPLTAGCWPAPAAWRTR